MENNVLAVVLAAIGFGLVSAVAAGGTVAIVLRRFANDKNALDNAEKLYLSFPPQTQDIIGRLADTLDAALEIVKKVSDGKPNELPPAV